jgi:hypothetical protein
MAMAFRALHPRLGIQRRAAILCFLVLAAAWLIGRVLPEPVWQQARLLSRLCGYAALLAMLVPYVHVLRRFVRHRFLGSSQRWLNWHIGAAYLGFFFLLLHCRARADSGLTLILLALVWTVMLSGVAGFYGQKLLYRFFPRLIPYEYGLERLDAERQNCLDESYRLLAENQITNWKVFPTECAGNGLAKELSKALVQVCESCQLQAGPATVGADRRLVGQHGADLLGAELLKQVAEPLVMVAELLADGAPPNASLPTAGKQGAKTLGWTEVEKWIDTDRKYAKLRKSKLPPVWSAHLARIVETRQRELRALPDMPVTRASLIKVIGSNEGLNELIATQALLAEALTQAGKKDQSKKRDHCRVLLGRALYRALEESPSAAAGSATGGPSVTLSELRWSNRLALRQAHPNLLRDLPQAIAEFCDTAIQKCLALPFTLRRWARTGKESRRLYEGHYKRALELAGTDADRQLVEDIWRLVEKRRLLDLEYRLHSLGRLWLLVHGPCALAMLVLIIEHVAMSMRFGGF